MHVYKGYKYEPYDGAGQRHERATSREELERQYAESLATSSSGAPKPRKRRDMLPFIITGLSVVVAAACVIAWMFGYDMLVPLLAMNLVLAGGYVGWRMM